MNDLSDPFKQTACCADVPAFRLDAERNVQSSCRVRANYVLHVSIAVPLL